jgi:3-hydroxybutyrate dehydrogenase
MRQRCVGMVPVAELPKVAATGTANRGITVKALCPGWVLTPLVQSQLGARVREKQTTFDDEATTMLRETQPWQAFPQPSAIAELCLLLCSEAAATITGAALSVDGGWVAH